MPHLLTIDLLLENCRRVGKMGEVYDKCVWLKENNIELTDWQLRKFTGYDRGMGKSYVAMMESLYSGENKSFLDPDCTTIMRKRSFEMLFRKMSKTIKPKTSDQNSEDAVDALPH